MTDTISVPWLAFAAVMPMPVALGVAWPFWRRVTRDPVGTLAGCSVVLGFAVAMVGREMIHLQGLTAQCVSLEIACSYHPEPFTRFFMYISIAMVQVFALFVIGWQIENRLRQGEVAPEWRR
jgi:hypothetical protein